MTVRHGCHAAPAAGCAPVKPRHPGVEAGLVDEDQPCAPPVGLGLAPTTTRGLDLGPCLRGDVRRFFYSSGRVDQVDARAR